MASVDDKTLLTIGGAKDRDVVAAGNRRSRVRGGGDCE